MLALPSVFEYSDSKPFAVLVDPVVSDARALVPVAVLVAKANELNKKIKKGKTN